MLIKLFFHSVSCIDIPKSFYILAFRINNSNNKDEPPIK